MHAHYRHACTLHTCMHIVLPACTLSCPACSHCRRPLKMLDSFHVCMYVCTYMHAHCLALRMHAHACMYVRMHVCMYARACMHIVLYMMYYGTYMISYVIYSAVRACMHLVLSCCTLASLSDMYVRSCVCMHTCVRVCV